MPSTANKVHGKAIGRRKSAVASAYLSLGTGKVLVNGKDPKVYFGGAFASDRLLSPLKATSNEEKYDVSLKVVGGGSAGQLEACILAIARALVEHKSGHKTALRTAGLLTRDSRERQRRMVGTGGKARRRKQSPKR